MPANVARDAAPKVHPPQLQTTSWAQVVSHLLHHICLTSLSEWQGAAARLISTKSRNCGIDVAGVDMRHPTAPSERRHRARHGFTVPAAAPRRRCDRPCSRGVWCGPPPREEREHLGTVQVQADQDREGASWPASPRASSDTAKALATTEGSQRQRARNDRELAMRSKHIWSQPDLHRLILAVAANTEYFND